MIEKPHFTLPVGYHDFHKKQVFNFQFNRWYSLGFARYEDMEKAGKSIHDFSDWKKVMLKLAHEAESDGRLLNAAIYYRGASFYMLSDDPDKGKYYDKFIDLFYSIFKNDGIERHKIPFDKAFLYALKVPTFAKEKKGTILMHGGFDSWIEEFYPMMKVFSDKGYEVIAFEGPGQGGTRKDFGLVWNQEWEKPTKAILDYFKLDNVTLYGISMGGYLCLRAAAFEPRIKHVITSGGAVDYWKIASPPARWLMKLFLHYDNFTNRQLVKKMKKDLHHNWFVDNSIYISGIQRPVDAMLVMFEMTGKNMHPENIKQDVLVLSSRNDHFIPIKMHKKMIKALANARSVKGRIFTKAEQAHNHCQIGNIGLVCDVVLDWLDGLN